MRLIDNKVDSKVFAIIIITNQINLKKSRWVIWDNQDIWINDLITSNNLIWNIYNEINR